MSATNQASGPLDAKIGVERINMVAAHNLENEVSKITVPTLILCGEFNICTEYRNSVMLHKLIPASKMVTFPDCGELIEIEEPDKYFSSITEFIAAQGE